MLQVTEGGYRLAELLPEDRGPLVHRPVGRQNVTVYGETAAQSFAGLADRVGIAGRREAAYEPPAVLQVRALFLACDTPGAQELAER